MRPIDTHNLTRAQAAHIIPHNFHVVEDGSALEIRLLYQLVDTAAPRRNEKRLTRHRVMVDCFTGVLPEVENPFSRILQSVAVGLVVKLNFLSRFPGEATDTLSRGTVAVKS